MDFNATEHPMGRNQRTDCHLNSKPRTSRPYTKKQTIVDSQHQGPRVVDV